MSRNFLIAVVVGIAVALSNWRCYGSYRVPTTPFSLNHCGASDFVVLTPFLEDFGYATNFDISRGSPVDGLLRSSCPAAIFRGVPTVIVNSINCVARVGSLPHVGVESRKRLPPSLADRNSSSSVIWKLSVISVVTPPNHFPPRLVVSGVRKSVDSPSVDGEFSIKATAALAVPVFNRVERSCFYGSAVANANTTCDPKFIKPGISDYGPPVKFLADWHLMSPDHFGFSRKASIARLTNSDTLSPVFTDSFCSSSICFVDR